MAGERVLIMDDEAPARRLLRRCLEAEGFRISEAAGADAALGHVEGAGVDLVTLVHAREVAARFRSVLRRAAQGARSAREAGAPTRCASTA